MTGEDCLISFPGILTIVVPVFAVIAAGYGTGRMHLFDGGRAEAMRDPTMQLALPTVMRWLSASFCPSSRCH